MTWKNATQRDEQRGQKDIKISDEFPSLPQPNASPSLPLPFLSRTGVITAGSLRTLLAIFILVVGPFDNLFQNKKQKKLHGL
jgi:hypothetical protein